MVGGRGLLALGIAAALGGCAGGGSSLLVDVALDGAAPAPASLRVTLYGARLLGVPSLVPLAGRSLPGTLLIAPLDANAPDFRLLLDGLDGAGAVTSQAFARPALAPNMQTTASLTLAALGADGDGDGVPDAIDDCPAVADPNQDCTTAIDLSAPDRAAPTDFSTAPADLARTDHGAAPSDMLAALACPATTFFCEGFENGLGAWSVNTLTGGNTVADNSKFPYHGTHSLDAIALSQTVSSQAAVEHGFNAAATVSARAFVYTPSQLGNYGLAVQLYGGASEDHAVSVGEDSFGNWILTEYLNGPTNDHSTSIAYQSAHWACVEIFVSMSGGMQRVQAWVDGQAITDFMPAATVNYDLLIVGYGRVPQNTASEVFIDDVAIGTQRIGCE